MMAQCVFHLDDTAVFILYLLFGFKYIYIVERCAISNVGYFVSEIQKVRI